MSEETRICKACGEEKPITCFYKQGGTNRAGSRHWQCSKCYNKQCMERRASTPERLLAHQSTLKAWKANNPERHKALNRQALKKWRVKHPELRRRERKAWKRKNKRRLGNSYIAELLGLPTAVVPPALLEAKRHLVKANRILYRLQNRTRKQNAPESN